MIISLFLISAGVQILDLGMRIQNRFSTNVIEPLETQNYMDPPRKPYSLKNLVEELQNATVDKTDTDGDGLYDSVEWVIGTDYNNSDSDFDQLNDTYEINNRLDPLIVDTNMDGLPDYFEVEGIYSLDIDGDGIENAWDFDNDDDGVNDEIDLSPFAKSTIHQNFDFSITTDGKPININFQLKPQSEEHLKLFYQSWNWPYDDKGTMQDLDNSENDVTIAPWLRVTPNVVPSQSEVDERGMYVTGNAMEFPLIPTYDKGKIVAFQGSFYYPEKASMTLDLQVELIWKVTGYTDLPALALNASNGNIVAIRDDGVLVANATEANDGMLQWIDLGENKIALKVQNGLFITVMGNGILASNASSIGDAETFTANRPGNQISLRAHNGNYVTVGANDLLVANTGTETWFTEIDQGYAPDQTPLTTYTEPFMLTGFGVEENYNCNGSIFYHEDRNQTMAANMFMINAFTFNATTILDDMPALLIENNVTIHNQSNFTFDDNYEAITYMCNEMIPDALSSFSGSQIVPLIMATEEASKMVDMIDTLAVNTSIMDDSWAVDFTGEDLLITKSLKMNFYNSSTFVALNFSEVMDEIETWGLVDNATSTLEIMMLRWYTGITQTTRVGGIALNFTPPKSSERDIVNAVALTGLNALFLIATAVLTYQAYRFLASLLDVPVKVLVSSRVGVSSLRSLSTLGAASGTTKLTRALQFLTKSHVLDVIGVLIGIGLSIWAGVQIANAIGGRLGREMGAAYGIAGSIVAIVYGIVLAVLFQSVIGAVIAIAIIILDLIFGFSSKLTKWLAQVLFGSPHDYHHAEPDTQVEGPLETRTFDWDENGLDVGDRIELTAHLIGKIEGKGESKTLQSGSWNVPWISIDAPDGSGSTTSMNLEHSLDNNAYNWHTQTTLLNRTHTDPYGRTKKVDKYDSAAWIEPGISMINFPVKLQIASRYKLMQQWYHYPVWYFGFKCWHTDWQRGKTPAEDLNTLYYDVMPGNLNDFLNWGVITENDRDGDGLNDTYETSLGLTNVLRYDTDADGLNDKYELDIGTDPQSADTDEDALLDGHEMIYGCDPKNSDSDNDGIYDWLEVSGWVISFNYSGQVFEMRVFSDPTNNDTDGDGVDDETEYWSGLNPRSSDTNGDGEEDVGIPITEKCGVLDHVVNIENDVPDFIANASELAVDANGSVYVPVQNGTSNDYFILKLDSNLTYLDNWSLSFKPGKVVVDDVNEYLYVENLTGDSFSRFYLNGTLMNGSLAVGTKPITGVDVDSSGHLYVARFNPGSSIAQIDKYFSNGTLSSTYGSYGSNPDQFDNLGAIAVDDTNEVLYALDGDRIVKLNSSDGEYIATLPNGYQNMIDIATDVNGMVYVLDHFDPGIGEGCVRKFDHNGMEDRNFVLTNSSNSPPWDLIHYPMRLAISQNVTNTSYYVLEQPTLNNSNPNILKFHENVTLVPREINGSLYDWDADELGNLEEILGWSITWKNNMTIYNLDVNCSPFMIDTDFDGLSDYEEFLLRSHPWNPDTDGDGLSDAYEYEIGTNLTNDDTDEDGLSDSNELLIGSNPYNKSDTDGEGLSDLIEFQLGSNPASNDTDNDGADDLLEYTGNSFNNSSLLLPDTDDDYLLDGLEYALNCDPRDQDTDDDGLMDGDELVHNTNATLSDTDDDGLLDGMEVDLWLNPLNNDTDGDGLTDAIELEWGSNPFVNDTDYDGVPDGDDVDTVTNFTEPIILCYEDDPDGYNAQFAANFTEANNVTVVSYENFTANHTNAQFIVLVGRPDPSNDTLGGLMYELLSDTGDELTAMMDNATRHFTVRRGVWIETQTVVMVSRAYFLDVNRVVKYLKDMNVTKTSSSYVIEYQTTPIMHNDTNYLYGMVIDEIDTVKATDTILSITIGNWSRPTIHVSRYVDFTGLQGNSGIPMIESSRTLRFHSLADWTMRSLGTYVQVDVTANGTALTQVQDAILIIMYTEADLDRDGNGVITDPWDINENTLQLYYFDETTGLWIKISADLDWVIDYGINTTDFELYGESYAGFIWIEMAHLSLFSVAGVEYMPYWTAIIFAIIFLPFLFIAIMGIYLAYREIDKRSKKRIIKKSRIKDATTRPMDNVILEMRGKKMVIKFDLTTELGPSAKGKTILVANSKGGRRIEGTDISFGLIAYKYPEQHRFKAKQKREFYNIDVQVEGDIVKLTIDITKDFGLSSTGKSVIIASSRGNQPIEGTYILFGLNVYKKRKTTIPQSTKKPKANIVEEFPSQYKIKEFHDLFDWALRRRGKK